MRVQCSTHARNRFHRDALAVNPPDPTPSLPPFCALWALAALLTPTDE